MIAPFMILASLVTLLAYLISDALLVAILTLYIGILCHISLRHLYSYNHWYLSIRNRNRSLARYLNSMEKM
jgi:hypothetical protein